MDIINGIYSGDQRSISKAISLVEKENKSSSLCCGAGGALWWKKETQGRTHLVRAEQVIESGADTVVTGCNFCYGMMKQGLGPLTPEGREEVLVKDVADIVAENLI